MKDITACVEYPCRTLNFSKVAFSFSIKKTFYTNHSIKMINRLKRRANSFVKIHIFEKEFVHKEGVLIHLFNTLM